MKQNNLVAIISGAAHGLGYVMAQEFARAGYNVVGFDIMNASFKEANIHFIKADLKSETEIKKVFDYALQTFGPIHILINNGAISKFHKDIYEISTEDFKNVIDVNLTGSFVCAKQFIHANKGANFGRIINIASTRWNQNEAGWEAYGASKGGLVSLTHSLCISLANTSITVNAISPGWIEANSYEELSQSDHQQHPSGRVGKPEDISNAALFLADEDNGFINGANLVIDGGMSKKMIYDNSQAFWNE